MAAGDGTAYIPGLTLYPIVEAIGEKGFGKNQPDHKPHQQPGHELAHTLPRNGALPFEMGRAKHPS
jgi:hypothetical protein